MSQVRSLPHLGIQLMNPATIVTPVMQHVVSFCFTPGSVNFTTPDGKNTCTPLPPSLSPFSLTLSLPWSLGAQFVRKTVILEGKNIEMLIWYVSSPYMQAWQSSIFLLFLSRETSECIFMNSHYREANVSQYPVVYLLMDHFMLGILSLGHVTLEVIKRSTKLHSF